MTVNALQSFLERGPERRAALENALAYYIPPELRGWLGLANELNPVVSMERAGGAAEAVADPNVQGWDKVAAVGDMTSNMANALAPVVLGSSGAVPAANAVEEALMGFSAASPMAYAARDFVADEFGGVGFRAYHGSPHDFDRFSLDKIGTGEGAQAYGHGLYFAENEAVAKGYRDNLSLPTGTTARDTAARILDEHGGDYEAALSDIGNRFNRALGNGKMDPAEYDRWMKAQRLLLNKDPVLGRMYEVQINADPNDFLDSDTILKKQPESIRAALDPALEAIRSARMNEYDRKEILSGKATGAQLYGALSNVMPGGSSFDRAASATSTLRDAGIPGIRYLDAGSRGAGDGSRNYVVFDDKLIDIIRKYGWAAAAPMLATYGISEAEAREMRPDLAQEDKNALSGFLAERGL